MPTDCIGLLDDRGNTGANTSPREATNFPLASSTATEPRWNPSTKPDRTTSARTSLEPAYVTSANLAHRAFYRASYWAATYRAASYRAATPSNVRACSVVIG